MNKTALSNFSRDLADPQAGLDTDLYKAISPMVGGGLDPEAKGPEADNLRHLHEQMRQGIVGAKYLAGLKKNTGETFYDEHPTQAVATDLSKSAPMIGGGIAAGGVLANLLRQHKNMKMTEPSRMSSDKNPLDPNNAEELLHPKKGPARSDISAVFGDLEANPEQRLKILDQLTNKVEPAGTSNLHGEYLKLKKAKPTPRTEKQLKDLFDRARRTAGGAALPDYVRAFEAMRKGKESGGFSKYMGEFLHSPGGKVKQWLAELLAPGKNQAYGDILEKNRVTAAQPHYNEELVKGMLKHLGGGTDLHTTPEGQAMMNSTLKNVGDAKYQSSGLRKALGRHKLPLAVGGAVALGGMGMHQLLKAIQNQMYSKDKQNEWKKTLLQSRGDFDAAQQIQ